MSYAAPAASGAESGREQFFFNFSHKIHLVKTTTSILFLNPGVTVNNIFG